MIQSIKVTNYLNESIEFELTNPGKSGFYVQDVTGLGPPLATINTTEISTNDGALFNSSMVTSRNIVLTLGFLCKDTIEEVRHLSYKYFPIKRRLKLSIKTNNRVGEVYGFVESNEPVIFSQMQTTQISIICPDPFFYSEDTHVTLFVGVLPMFQFPFSNESLSQNLLIMGEMQSGTSRVIHYQGDAEIGVVMYINALGDVSDITIFDPNTEQKMVINMIRLAELTGSGMVEGDSVVISTVRGDKYITLVREGVETNILNCLNRDAFWFQLRKGDNIFGYTAEFGLANLDFRIENRTVYEGV